MFGVEFYKALYVQNTNESILKNKRETKDKQIINQ